MNERDIALTLSKQREAKEDAIVKFRGVIVKQTNSVGLETIEVENRPLYVWVRLWNTAGSVVPCWNDQVAAVDGATVWVAPVPGDLNELEIIGVDRETFQGEDSPNVNLVNPLHASAHEWPDGDPGLDVVTVYPRSWSQLRVYPQDPLSLLVNVSPITYAYGNDMVTYGGGFIDLTAVEATLAAGEARLTLVYLDLATNTLSNTNGDIGADAGGWFLDEPDVTDATYPSAVVRIHEGQTEIDESDIRDRRMFLNGSPKSDRDWPYDTEILSVDSTDPDADYATVAAAITAAAASNLILISPEQHTCDNQTLPSDVDLGAWDRWFSSLTTTTQLIILTLGGSNHVFGIYVFNGLNNAGNTEAIRVDGSNCDIRNVWAQTANGAAGGDGTGFYIVNNRTDIRLTDCDGNGSSVAGSSYGLYIPDGGSASVIIRDGSYEGGTADVFIGSGSTALFLGPRLVNGTIGGTGTVSGWYYDDAGNYISAGSGVLDLDGLADGLVFDADGDTTASAPVDGQIDWEIEGTDRFTFEPAGILGAGGVLPDLGSTTAVEKWGNIYLGPNKDVYARDEEEYGLYNRTVNFTETPHNHFETGFSTLALANGVIFDNAPTVSSFGLVPSCWQVYDNVNGTRVFAQEARGTFTKIACRLFTGPFVEFAGLRVDAGDDDDYFELGFRTQGIATAGTGEFIKRVRVGAGAVTTTVLFTPVLAGQFFCFRITGIGSTNFMYYKVDSPGWVYLGSLGNPAWTESRIGLAYEIGTAGSADRAGIFDWYGRET